MKYLIVGVSGSGKSAVEKVIREKGYRTIDIDDEPELTDWVNKITKEKGNYIPGKVTSDWLDEHDWLWDEKMMSELLAKDPQKPVFVIGVTSDILDQAYRFDKIFLLQIPPEVVRKRLQERPGKDEFGKSETEIAHVLSWQLEFEQSMIKKGAIVIDATQPIENVAEGIISEILTH